MPLVRWAVLTFEIGTIEQLRVRKQRYKLSMFVWQPSWYVSNAARLAGRGVLVAASSSKSVNISSWRRLRRTVVRFGGGAGTGEGCLGGAAGGGLWLERLGEPGLSLAGGVGSCVSFWGTSGWGFFLRPRLRTCGLTGLRN